MKTRPFDVLAGVSLVLCVATVGLWVRSCYSPDSIWLTVTPKKQAFLDFDSQCVRFSRHVKDDPPIKCPYPSWPVQLFVNGKPLGPPTSPAVLASFGWEKQFGPDINWHLLGIWLTAFPEISRPMSNMGTKAKVGYWTEVAVPYWFLALLFLSFPFARWLPPAIRQFNRRSQISNVCRTCGYDLRATPDRCPECGGVPQKVNG